TKAPPKYDPHAVELWGFRKDPLMALVAAAVVARLPHPYAPVPARPALVGAVPAPGGDDHGALLRRLRELADLHQAGILTDDEFTTAKQAVLKRL
ncbi:SHOCT domain-containing protein, partial [Streptomyces sp. NPDC056437]|uniref:SHOCT domain-containing protein n=1 Tax=Streptomyces sp. NPDC056437 TaxID=3345816 RepID=UPI00367E1D06